MTNRRRILQCGGIMAAATLIPIPSWASESRLIYLSPVKSDGTLSRCQAEVWYVGHESDMYVVTATDAWRARAVRQGLTQTRVWVGDVGMWRRSNGKYKELPEVAATATQVDDPETHTEVLAVMGRKYSAEWGTWGPRFKNGLADGSRVMLRYSPA